MSKATAPLVAPPHTMQPDQSHGESENSMERNVREKDVRPVESVMTGLHDPTETPAPITRHDIEEWKPDYRFWAIIISLSLISCLAGLENTIIITALPFIIRDIGGGHNYVWVANVHFLTGAAILPLFGQLANIWGRRRLTFVALGMYTLGSGLCGGAYNEAMLVAGRALQGAGGASSLLMMEVVIADLCPVKYRGQYLAVVLGIGGVLSILGPSVGGLMVQYSSWRWIFYLNLPICAAAGLSLYIFLRVDWNRSGTLMDRLNRIDYVGNLLITGSTTSAMLALAWAGTKYPWGSVQVIAPLVLGLVGIAGFFCYESLSSVKEPLVPLEIFKPHKRASIILFINTFIIHALLYWINFFLPVYFQAVLLNDPSRAAVLMLPLSLFAVVGGVFSTTAMTRWGRYKWLHLVGLGLFAGGMGTMSLLRKGDPVAKYICLQITPAIGVGFLFGTLLPAFQACASEKHQAAATASWTWIRSVGYLWGVTIAAAIFDQYIVLYAADIQDETVRELFTTGSAFSLATKDFVESFQEPLRSQIQVAFEQAFIKVIQVSVSFAGLGFILALFEHDVEMRTDIVTDYGLETETKVLSNRTYLV